MPQHEVRGDRAVYDHETEEPRGGSRRRQVADWGVGEELFEHMPSPRRRFRAADAHPVRRDAHQRPRRHEPPTRVPLVPIDEAPTREHALPAPAAEPRDEAPRDATPRGGVDGRRTVVISGQASLARRPPRTVGERLGPRPDRIAGWAVALGVLLIVITILSQ